MEDMEMKKLVIPAILAGCLATACPAAPAANVTLNVTHSSWAAETNSSLGYVYLTLAGQTTGAKVCVRTYGDGLVYDQALALNSGGEFSNRVCIRFTHSPHTNEFTCDTTVFAYEKSDPPAVTGTGDAGTGVSVSTNLASGNLQYYQ